MIKQVFYWYRKYVPQSIQKFLKSIKPKWFDYLKLDLISRKNIDFSGHGETQAVKNFLDNSSSQVNYYVDIGASDGVSSSSTLEFAKNDNWSGLSIEFDNKKFSKLKFVYRKYRNITLANTKVTPSSIVSLFEQHSVPDNLTFINIDIDSYDLDVISTILQEGYKPDIVSIEINEKIPPPIYFKVIFDENHYWKGDHFYGCSINAAKIEFSKFDYKLADFKMNNAVFVNSRVFPMTKDLDATSAYDSGYRNVPNRKSLFKYNHDVEDLLTLENNEKIKFINNLYSDYKNMYVLKIGEFDE
jgi:hypothetical protein